jgi:cytidylate kinase
MPSIEKLIDRQFRQWEMEKSEWVEPPQAVEPPMEIVTISRENGSRGSYFARLLAQELDYQLIHKETVDAICESSGYRKRIIASLDEHYRSRLEVMVQSFLTGQAVDHSDYTRHLISVVLSMAHLGGVVLVGRGGNFILGPNRGFHMRFICHRNDRILNLETYCNLSQDEAAAAIDRSDSERRDVIRKVFGADINDPHHYDVVLNTAYIDIEGLVRPTVAAIKLKLNKLAHSES